MEYPAHIRKVDGKKYIQTVEEHCHGVAEIAAELLRDIGLEKTAYLAGIIHDLGKFSQKLYRESSRWRESSARISKPYLCRSTFFIGKT